MTVTISIPSLFVDEDDEIGLQGKAQITRIDEEREGIAIQFVGDLTEVEPNEDLELAGEFRYRKLAYYLSSVENFSVNEFENSHPNGFLVERSNSILDKDVVFQFGTQQLEDQGDLRRLEKSTFQADILEARVIEIKKSKATAATGMIKIGRSAENDIILYNKLVSKFHACLYFPSGGEGAYLVDPGSRNHTFLNHEKVTLCKMYQLMEGDEISFGLETKVI